MLTLHGFVQRPSSRCLVSTRAPMGGACVQQAASRALPPGGLRPQPIQRRVPWRLLSFGLVDCSRPLPLLLLRVLLLLLIVSYLLQINDFLL